MSLRIADIADIPAMHEVRLSVRENVLTSSASVTPKRYRTLLSEDGRGWVYELDGAIVGFVVADAVRRNIWALFVRPEHEGQGIGRTLHDAALDWLFAQGSEPVWLETEPNTRALRFYDAAGWQRGNETAKGALRLEMRTWRTGSTERARGLRLLPETFAIVRLEPDAEIPSWSYDDDAFCSVTRTANELSLICAEVRVPDHHRAERGWRAFEVAGPIGFDAAGVLASLASALSSAGVSLLSISTYDTDYVLVREADLEIAAAALEAAGWDVDRDGAGR